MIKYKGISISGISKNEFNKTLRDPFWGSGKDELTLREILDPHIKWERIKNIFALIIALPIVFIIVLTITKFVFLPMMILLFYNIP